MFNLLISGDPQAWDTGSYEFDKSRVAVEYTVDEISERYKFFDAATIEELKTFPTLFVTENEQTASKIGYITDIQLRSSSIALQFVFDQNFPELPQGTVKRLENELELGGWELSRTHWAIKDVRLFDVLLRSDLITQDQVHLSQQTIGTTDPELTRPL